MKYVKTFEQHSLSTSDIINEEGFFGKLVNKASAKSYKLEDYKKNNEKDLVEAAKKHLDSTYEGGKITKSARWEIVKKLRGVFKDGGVSDDLLDVAVVTSALYAGAIPFVTFDEKIAEKEQKGSLLKYDEATKTLTFTPAGDKSSVNPNG